MGIAGKDVKITSYINNLRPILHADLYSVIEKFIAKSIPLWDLTLTSTYGGRQARIPHDYTDYDYSQPTRPPDEFMGDPEGWIRAYRVLQWPEPRDFEPYRPSVATQVSLRERF